MKTLKQLKNSELTAEFSQDTEQKIVLALTGQISTSLTFKLLDTEESVYKELIFANEDKLERVVLDLRGLQYVNSIGAAILMRLYGSLKKHPFKIVLVFETDSEAAFIMDTLGFFLAQKPVVVWDDLKQALTV